MIVENADVPTIWDDSEVNWEFELLIAFVLETVIDAVDLSKRPLNVVVLETVVNISELDSMQTVCGINSPLSSLIEKMLKLSQSEIAVTDGKDERILVDELEVSV